LSPRVDDCQTVEEIVNETFREETAVLSPAGFRAAILTDPSMEAFFERDLPATFVLQEKTAEDESAIWNRVIGRAGGLFVDRLNEFRKRMRQREEHVPEHPTDTEFETIGAYSTDDQEFVEITQNDLETHPFASMAAFEEMWPSGASGDDRDDQTRPSLKRIEKILQEIEEDYDAIDDLEALGLE
jgi:hypothetical protein